jgi:hypothetical protein
LNLTPIPIIIIIVYEMGNWKMPSVYKKIIAKYNVNASKEKKDFPIKAFLFKIDFSIFK